MKAGIYGAIIGDIAGMPYEFVNPRMKDLDFEFITKESTFTDDTVMSIAIAKAIMDVDIMDKYVFEKHIVSNMRKFGKDYWNTSYGMKFREWLTSSQMQAYNSFGNGSAMRVSAIGNYYNTLEDTRMAARYSAEVTHNHPEGVKGAESVASVMWLARNGIDKYGIRKYVINEFGYDLDFELYNIRPEYKFDVTCQGSVPHAIVAFLEGKSFEDCVRLAVSLGGDSDTQGAIAGAMASMLYPISDEMIITAREKLPKGLRAVADEFQHKCRR